MSQTSLNRRTRSSRVPLRRHRQASGPYSLHRGALTRWLYMSKWAACRAPIQQTMKYARFHPEYSDVREYFEAVPRVFGLTSPYRLTADERMNKAAALLGIDAADLDAAVETAGCTLGCTHDTAEDVAKS